MPHFAISSQPLDTPALRAAMNDVRAGGFVCFEGWVRDSNDGRRVLRLGYEAFVPLAEKEGMRILGEAMSNYPIFDIRCVHRIGTLELGDLAVWVGVSSQHRGAAFDACRYVIDEVKSRVPIWKKEHYVDGDSGWINCHILPA
ncbi:MAG: molybdenum cofactor biosynthesis protein MoaE [Opitutaceae bacterium]|nr:molybdenum cofactor biosynthesis protein MoaE [Opitutaceae bacterium]